ncbi:MAG: hypothetical protein ACJ76Y_13460 [Thermoanaerobaculia bacterium]
MLAGPDLERYLSWRGQLLRSRDLNDTNAGEEERLFWHNRAVHDAYGVVVGLAVDPGTGVPPEVTVHPGLAYDAYGRELAVLAQTPVPPPRDVSQTAEIWLLLLRHREGASGPDGCGCGGAGAPGSELVWRRARRAGIRDGVALARGWWISGAAGWLFRPDERFHPQRARAFARPHLGHGETPRGGTPWRSWSEPPGPTSGTDLTGAALPGIAIPAGARGIEASVDTSAAGFTRTPCYFAWLQGGLWQVPHRLAPTVLPDRVTGASRDRFTFSLWDPASSTVTPAATNEAGQSLPLAAQGSLLNFALQRLYVCWLGIEMDSTVPYVQPSALAVRPLEPEPR